MIVIKNVEMVCKLKSLWSHNSNIFGDSRWSVCKVLDRYGVSIHVHSESQARAIQFNSIQGLPIPNAEQFNSTFWHLNAFEQPFLQVQVMLWKVCSGASSEIFLVLAGKGRVNPWSGAIWLIWTVLAKAKTSTTHRLKFWNTFLGSGDLKTDVKNLTIVFSRSLRYTLSIHTSRKKTISPF